MNLKIVSTTKELLDKKVESVYIPTVTGIIGILENHENLITVLDIGELKYTIDGKTSSIFITGGFVKITDGNVYLLADDAEMSHELLKERIDTAIELAQEKIESELDPTAIIHLEKHIRRYKRLKKHKFKR